MGNGSAKEGRRETEDRQGSEITSNLFGSYVNSGVVGVWDFQEPKVKLERQASEDKIRGNHAALKSSNFSRSFGSSHESILTWQSNLG